MQQLVLSVSRNERRLDFERKQSLMLNRNEFPSPLYALQPKSKRDTQMDWKRETVEERRTRKLSKLSKRDLHLSQGY